MRISASRWNMIALAGTAALLASCAMGPGEKEPRLKEKKDYPGARAGKLSEGKRSVTGRLSVKEDPGTGFTSLMITRGDGPSIEAMLPEGMVVSRVDPQAVYQVDLFTRIYRDPDYVCDDVRRVSDARGRVIMDSSVCHLHGVSMQRQVEKGVSAEDYPDSFSRRRRKEFPNDGRAYLACGSGISHMTWHCQECDKRYRTWAKRIGIEDQCKGPSATGKEEEQAACYATSRASSRWPRTSTFFMKVGKRKLPGP